MIIDFKSKVCYFYIFLSLVSPILLRFKSELMICAQTFLHPFFFFLLSLIFSDLLLSLLYDDDDDNKEMKKKK